MDSQPSYIRTRLSAMFFLQFFIWASWFVPIGGYIISTLKFEGHQVGWIFATTALGAIISPLLVGYIADRLFSTERVLCVLHLIGGVCLCLAATQTKFTGLMTLLMVNAVCFMPTLALANSLAFRNIPDPDKFPRIAMFGSIGWIVSGLGVGFLLGETSPWFLYLAGGAGILMGLYCLTLPHTPPKGAGEAGGDVFGLGAIKLLKEPSFLIFAISAFLIAIPATFYFVGCNAMLVETNRPVPTALMTIGQCTEIVVMFTMPFFIFQLGLRRILVIGMVVWALRYVCFGSLSFPLILLGLIVHGFAYCFVFVGAYIYVDKRAPRDMRASAQSLIAFLMLGVGMFIGSQLAGFTMGRYPAPVPAFTDTPKVASLAAQIDADESGRITGAELLQIPDEGLKVDKDTFEKETVSKFFRQVDAGKVLRTKADFRDAIEGKINVTRDDWLQAQSHQWLPFWLWPAGGAALICVFFLLGSREEKDEKAEDEPETEPTEEQAAEPTGGEPEEQ